MDINEKYIEEYKRIIQTTNLQRGYQEVIKFFRYFRIYLEKEMNNYVFTGNIVENNMDYSYFQFTNERLKKRGLKIVIAFVHKDFKYEVWLSGINRKVQNEYYNKLNSCNHKHILTTNPNRTDYILKATIDTNHSYNDLEHLLINMKGSIVNFIDDIGNI